jgi:uncharacterized protein
MTPSADTEPYWRACREGRLAFQQCRACGEVVFHPRALCPYCLADALDWRASQGHGSVYACAVQHLRLDGRPGGEPRVLGIAALDEGFHLFTEFLARDAAAVAIGDRVQVEFGPGPHGRVLPRFRVAAR